VKIKKILDDEIRPAVAMDGGDITFDKFVDGVVYLFLQGSCSGCPSSALTLKMGIEGRLKEAIPEIKEVVAI
jgi:Fe-S cluster biogenesis protein NfuA